MGTRWGGEYVEQTVCGWHSQWLDEGGGISLGVSDEGGGSVMPTPTHTGVVVGRAVKIREHMGVGGGGQGGRGSEGGG